MTAKKFTWVIVVLLAVGLVGWIFWRNRGWEINKPLAGQNIIIMAQKIERVLLEMLQ